MRAFGLTLLWLVVCIGSGVISTLVATASEWVRVGTASELRSTFLNGGISLVALGLLASAAFDLFLTKSYMKSGSRLCFGVAIAILLVFSPVAFEDRRDFSLTSSTPAAQAEPTASLPVTDALSAGAVHRPTEMERRLWSFQLFYTVAALFLAVVAKFDCLVSDERMRSRKQ